MCLQAYLRVIVPMGKTAFFEEMSRWWRAVGKLVRFPIWLARDLNLRPPAPKKNALPF